MEIVKVYSPVNDDNINRRLIDDSPIWKGLKYTEDEVVEARKTNADLYEYSIKFDGLKPVQVTNVKKLP